MPKEEERRMVNQIDSIGSGGAVCAVLAMASGGGELCRCALMVGDGSRPCDEGKGNGSTGILLEQVQDRSWPKETQNYEHCPPRNNMKRQIYPFEFIL